ncbi:MAG TPA: Rid family detoxifying hydrolase [Bacteroidia bacterium]|jgi:2-iminobutanoate/2-iminopropanoate deaminase|nr:Rid family detoxifying hydrolase [Bacteroidia bacterium]
MNKKLILLSSLALFGIFAFTTNGNKSKHKIIFTENAPKPIGPYSQAVFVENTLYLAGQVGLNPATGKLDSTGVVGETQQALKNIYAVLQAADMDMTHIVKTTIYLKNIKDFEKVNKEYATYFEGMPPPARETVGIADLPRGANIEISVIAVK